jgi:hypothetical protein
VGARAGASLTKRGRDAEVVVHEVNGKQWTIVTSGEVQKPAHNAQLSGMQTLEYIQPFAALST